MYKNSTILSVFDITTPFLMMANNLEALRRILGAKKPTTTKNDAPPMNGMLKKKKKEITYHSQLTSGGVAAAIPTAAVTPITTAFRKIQACPGASDDDDVCV